MGVLEWGMVALRLVVRVGNENVECNGNGNQTSHFLPAGTRCTLGLSTERVWGHV